MRHAAQPAEALEYLLAQRRIEAHAIVAHRQARHLLVGKTRYTYFNLSIDARRVVFGRVVQKVAQHLGYPVAVGLYPYRTLRLKLEREFRVTQPALCDHLAGQRRQIER